MESLVHLSWRVYPAGVILALGVALALRGVLSGGQALRRALKGDSARNLAWIQGFRRAVIGLALAGAGASWVWHLDWLLVLSLAIGIEETLETSMIIYGLRRGQQQRGLQQPGTTVRIHGRLTSLPEPGYKVP